MASTSEELSGQAEQLQQTIAFFRLNNTGNQTLGRPKPTAMPKNAKQPRLAQHATRPQNKIEPAAEKKGHWGKESSGVQLEMGAGKDKFDEEFERY